MNSLRHQVFRLGVRSNAKIILELTDCHDFLLSISMFNSYILTSGAKLQ
jgi:hypothetical protein